MKVKTIRSSWLERDGRRLDCGPYTSGALESRIKLESLPGVKTPLRSLTCGPDGGIYNGPHFSRTWVEADYGVPFLGSAAFLMADLGNLPYLRRRDAMSSKLSHLRVKPGMTLISCSGTIGRMAYARPDMDGMWTSQHVMKVVPDSRRVPPGYVYAFLSGKFGVPLVTSGTYGSIIQSIDPEHIADLPVPRLGPKIEGSAHSDVESAANKRSRAVDLLREAAAEAGALLGKAASRSNARWNSVSSNRMQSRCDGYYYSEECQVARHAFDTAVVDKHVELGEVAAVFIPGIFKRRYADNPAYGRPYITGGDVFQLNPASEQFLMTRIVEDYGLAVRAGTILIQEAGQLGGLIGRSVFVGRNLDGFAVSNNMVRVTARERGDAGYLYALLSRPEGVTLIAREAAGSSIPHMDVGRLRSLRIPWPDGDVRRKIGSLVEEAVTLRDEACEDEARARSLVERAVEEAT
jgi:type I restriction enzyme S subunit